MYMIYSMRYRVIRANGLMMAVQYLLCIPIHQAPVIHLCQFEFSLLNNLCLPHNLNKQCELTKWTV